MRATIRQFERGDERECEAILRALPDWFGIEEALIGYARAATELPTWIAESNIENGPAQALGFVTVREHFPGAAEIHCIAVRPEAHRTGIGRMLVAHVERWLAARPGDARGRRFLQVKTLGTSRPDPNYALTRKFYEGLGFAPLEEFPTLWGRNPALMLIRQIGPESSLRLRPAHPADADAIRSIIARIYAEYGDVLDIEHEDPHLRDPCASFRAGGGELWVADAEGTVAGSGGVLLSGDGAAEIKTVYVDRPFRRRGLARALVTLAIDHARSRGCTRIGLWSDTRYTEAHRMYESMGFVRTGGRRVQLTNTFDEHRYELPLGGRARE